jgi:hypothetical protein
MAAPPLFPDVQTIYAGTPSPTDAIRTNAPADGNCCANAPTAYWIAGDREEEAVGRLHGASSSILRSRDAGRQHPSMHNAWGLRRARYPRSDAKPSGFRRGNPNYLKAFRHPEMTGQGPA